MRPSAVFKRRSPFRLIVIANPQSVRWKWFSQESHNYWRQRDLEADISLVPWSDVIARDGNLDGLPVFDEPAIIRLESPGRDFHVAKLLLEAGERESPEKQQDWRRATYQKGRLVHPRLQHAGFVRVLQRLQDSFNARPHLTLLASPTAVAQMFDKTHVCARLQSASLPTPEFLPEFPASASSLIDSLNNDSFCAREARRWFVKFNYGASACGVVILYSQPPATGLSTMFFQDGGFYNSRRLVKLRASALEASLQFLISESALVQRAITPAMIDGLNFDVRVIVIDGSPEFTIFRLNSGPITNLHFGGIRGDWERCRAAIPHRCWRDALDDCAAAASLFDTTIAGVDVLFERGSMQHYLLEVNAFGDFFPGYTDKTGRSIVETELATMGEKIANDKSQITNKSQM